jgi:phospholipase/carboxylesterase
MNRIQEFLGEASPVANSSSNSIESGLYQRREQGEHHSLFSPLHYERNYSYPLLVWLHGPNDDERQLKRIMPLVSLRNYVAVAPRGTVEAGEALGENEDTIERGFGWSQRSDHISLAESRVFAAVHAARQRFNVAENRIFLAGFASGGTMALRLALNHPVQIAGAASFTGTFPTGSAPLGRLAQARRLRLLLATGRDSVDYPQEQVCDHLRLFHSAGMSVNVRQYPCGDDLTTTMLSDMDRWIMDQILSPQNLVADETSSRGR